MITKMKLPNHFPLFFFVFAALLVCVYPLHNVVMGDVTVSQETMVKIKEELQGNPLEGGRGDLVLASNMLLDLAFGKNRDLTEDGNMPSLNLKDAESGYLLASLLIFDKGFSDEISDNNDEVLEVLESVLEQNNIFVNKNNCFLERNSKDQVFYLGLGLLHLVAKTEKSADALAVFALLLRSNIYSFDAEPKNENSFEKYSNEIEKIVDVCPSQLYSSSPSVDSKVGIDYLKKAARHGSKIARMALGYRESVGAYDEKPKSCQAAIMHYSTVATKVFSDMQSGIDSDTSQDPLPL